jgi:photosystem II stability/assembly factor-like uncharacterized protein
MSVPHDDIFALELSPTFSRDRTLFINVRRNLFRSTDAGRSWVRLVKGLDNRNFLNSLAISRQEDYVLYASSLGDGVYKSEDKGESWSKVNNGLGSLRIGKVFVSPHSAQVVFACALAGGLYKTSDAGNSWHQVIGDGIKVSAMGFSPDGKRVATGIENGDLHVSGDFGETYGLMSSFRDSGGITSISLPLDSYTGQSFFVGTEKEGIFLAGDVGKPFKKINRGLADMAVQDIAFLPGIQRPLGLMASTRNDGVFLSQDCGNSWERMSAGLTRDAQAEHPEQIKEKGLIKPRPHFSYLRVSDNFSKDKTLFLAGFDGLFKSVNGGVSWRKIETYPASLIAGLAVSPDYKKDSAVAVATYARGVFISSNAGASWKYLGGIFKFVLHQMHRFIKGDPEDKIGVHWARIYDIAYDAEKSLYFTILWSKTNLIKYSRLKASYVSMRGGGTAIALSPNFCKDKTLFLASQSGDIFISQDGGMTFVKLGKVRDSADHESISFLLSPDFARDRTMLYSDYKGVYRSEDAGLTWEPMARNTPLEERSNFLLSISPDFRNDKTLVVGTDQGVYISQDAGKSWRLWSDTPEVNNGFAEAVAISPDYANDRTFLVSVRGKGLFKTEDGGKSFKRTGDDSISLSRVDCPSASMPIQFSPSFAEDKTIYGYGAADARIFRSSDAGNSWEAIKLPIPGVSLFEQAYNRWLIAKELAYPFINNFKRRLVRKRRE